MPLRKLAFLFVAFALAAPASAHDYKLGDLTIDHPWARASAGHAKTGAAYFAVVNGGAEADRLVGASSPVGRAELHTHISEDGIMKMRPVDAVDLPAGERAVLEPGGLHVMLMDLAKPLVEGESFPLTLTFEKAGDIDVEVKVEGVTGMQGDHGDHDMQ
ncbi:MAG: hypothetical protein BroJett029_06900 [Alphaproteobacteria bacterium]|nr:MAG: hypothetical protein BroJett029_06900 [Alphaproteobacteria bacterium]